MTILNVCLLSLYFSYLTKQMIDEPDAFYAQMRVIRIALLQNIWMERVAHSLALSFVAALECQLYTRYASSLLRFWRSVLVGAAPYRCHPHVLEQIVPDTLALQDAFCHLISICTILQPYFHRPYTWKQHVSYNDQTMSCIQAGNCLPWQDILGTTLPL